MKKRAWILGFVLLLVVGWNTPAWSGFYVVPAGVAGKRTVLVSPQGTATQSGTALLNALTAVTDASAAKPYLIVIEPGVYDLGSQVLQMKAYVDIQGSGENVTTVTGTVSGTYAAVVKGVDNAGMRFLTVENTGGGSEATAICNYHASPRMANVTAVASGGTVDNRAVYNYFSSPSMTDVTAISSGGEENCAVYNDTSAPAMTNVTATASGGDYVSGVCNDNSSIPTMTNVTATASGATYDTQAVWNKGSSPTMIDVTATATGGEGAVGVRNDQGYPLMINVTASGSGATVGNYGMWNSATSGVFTINIHNSRLSGDSASIHSDSEFTVNIAVTQLAGGPADAGGGTLNCVNSYDGGFVPLNAALAGTVKDFLSRNPLPGVTVELLHNDTGLPFDPPIIAVSGPDGEVSLAWTPRNIQHVGVRCNYTNYMTTCGWGFKSCQPDQEFLIVSNQCVALMAGSTGEVVEPTKGQVIGTVYWNYPYALPEEGEPVGCAEVTSDPPNAGIYYCLANGLPDLFRVSTHPDVGAFMGFNYEPGPVVFTANADGNVESAEVPNLYANSVSLLNIYYPKDEYPTNPQGPGCN